MIARLFFSQWSTPFFLIAALTLTGVFQQPPAEYDEYPRTPEVEGDFIPIADQAGLEMSVSPGGILVLTADSSLEFYFGEDFSQRLPIQPSGSFFSLSKQGFERNGEILFSFVGDNDLKLLRITPGQGPQGAAFSIEDVAAHNNYWSSDLFVTPSGEVLVLGYFIAEGGGVFQPRLFLEGRGGGPVTQGTELSFEEIALGLFGVFLGAINGSPRMALVDHLFDGNVVYFWAVRQFSATFSELLAVELDLDEIVTLGAGAQSSQTGASYRVVALIRAPESFGITTRVESAALVVSTPSGLGLAFVHLDDCDFIHFQTLDLSTEESRTALLESSNTSWDEFRWVGKDAITVNGRTYRLFHVGSNVYHATRVGRRTGSQPGRKRKAAARKAAPKKRKAAKRKVARRKTARKKAKGHEIAGLEGPFNPLDAAGIYQGIQFSNEDPLPGQGTQGGGIPVLGFRRVFLGHSTIVPQIVKGQVGSQSLSTITVSNPEDFPQPVDWVFTNQDGTVFQSGSAELGANQRLQIDVEGEPAGQAGAAYFSSLYDLTIQSLVDLSSIVDTPGFGAPGVAAATDWTLPYENPQAATAAAGQLPTGMEVTRETGVAIHNVENLANDCTLTAYDANGEEAASELEEFLPGEQKALFVSQAFSGLTSAAGTIRIGCTLPVAVVGAQQESTGAIVLTPAKAEETEFE